MLVTKNIAKLNDNNCRNIVEYLSQGLTAIESFKLETKKCRHNPNKIIAYKYRNDKWYWIFKLLEMELNEIQNIQSY